MHRHNRILRALTVPDRDVLRPCLEWSQIPRGEVLVAPNARIDRLWFLERGLSSIVAMASHHHGVEVGMTGRDGLVGLPLLLDADRTPHRIFMQVEGAGYSILADDLHQILDAHPSIRRMLLRYVQAYATQATYTALSNVIHTIEERLARWLLMSHDRQDGDEIYLTHEFLALMLGVRRPSVTSALHSLEGLGLIRSTRGMVKVRDRDELEGFAGAVYGIPEAEYERLIGPLR